MNPLAQFPGPDSLAVMIPIIAFMIPIVAILTKHQQKMAEIVHGGQQNNSLNGQMDAMHRELRDMRELINRQAIQLDDLRARGQLMPPSQPLYIDSSNPPA